MATYASMRRHVSFVLLLFSLQIQVQAAPATPKAIKPRFSNGLAITPPMGWNSYNHYSCSPNETIVHSNAQALVSLGLSALGYHYVTVDCGWTLPNRTSAGELTWNPARFPSGYPALGVFIHNLDLGFGVYSDGGIQMCMTGTPAQAGSLGYETVDAKTFAAWGADLLKYDNCYSDANTGYPDTSYTPTVSPKGHYETMSAAVTATGRDIAFLICDWGVDFPSAWAPALGNTWRISNDIIPSYRTIARILNQVVPQTSFAGPGSWLDLDMLEVGNNVFTTPEEETHFSMWAILKSPLVIGCALKDAYTSISAASLAILKNTNVIGYNQDSLGVSASFRRRWTQDREIWAGPLSNSRTVVAVINLENTARSITLDLPGVGLQAAGTLKDIWNGVSTTNVMTSYTANVAAHGTLLLELGSTTAAGVYTVAHAVVSGTTTTFSKIYASTSSAAYQAVLTFTAAPSAAETITVAGKSYTLAAGSKTLSFTLSLVASNSNSLSIVSSTAVSSLNISPPAATFYAASSFAIANGAEHITCASGSCLPKGNKIASLGGTKSGSASLSITAPTTQTASQTSKFVELYFCNNDIALSTSWTTGSNTRNLTITVNSVTTRVELPLTGSTSELYSVDNGWETTGTFGVLVPGWTTGANAVTVGNQLGTAGLVSWGADFVGMGILW